MWTSKEGDASFIEYFSLLFQRNQPASFVTKLNKIYIFFDMN